MAELLTDKVTVLNPLSQHFSTLCRISEAVQYTTLNWIEHKLVKMKVDEISTPPEIEKNCKQ